MLAPWKKSYDKREGKWSEVKVAQSSPTFCDSMDCIVHGILQARILEWVAFPFSRGSSQPRDKTHLVMICNFFYVLLGSIWKWKLLSRVQLFVTLWNLWNSLGWNTGVGSLSLLQGIFPTQVSNSGLPHCRWILYQLSYQGSSLKIHWWGIINKICHWWIWML